MGLLLPCIKPTRLSHPTTVSNFQWLSLRWLTPQTTIPCLPLQWYHCLLFIFLLFWTKKLEKVHSNQRMECGGPHSQCSVKEIPKFFQYYILKMYFQLNFWFHVCNCNWSLAFKSTKCISNEKISKTCIQFLKLLTIQRGHFME